MFISKKSINTTHPVQRINPVVLNPEPVKASVVVPEKKKAKEKPVVKEEIEEPAEVSDNKEQK